MRRCIHTLAILLTLDRPPAGYCTPADTLSVLGTTVLAADTAGVEVVLKNAQTIGGTSWTLVYDSSAMAVVGVEQTERTANMEIYSHAAGDSINALILDPSTGQAIPPGEGAIALLRLVIRESVPDGIYPVTFRTVDLVNAAQPPERLAAVGLAGQVRVTSQLLSVWATGGSPGDTVSVSLKLHNRAVVAGFQAELSWPQDALSFVEALPADRISQWDLWAVARNGKGATVLAADLDGTKRIPPGEGTIAVLNLAIPDLSNRNAVPVSIESVRLADPEGTALAAASTNGEVTIVSHLNRSPQLSLPEYITTSEDSMLLWRAPAFDPDGDQLEFEAENLPEWLSLDTHTGEFSGVPMDMDVGVYLVSLRVSDGQFSVPDTIRLEVTNLPPKILGTPERTARAGAVYRYAPEVRNLDGGSVRIEPDGMDILCDAESGLVTWRPENTGEFRLRLIAEDPNGGEAVQAFSVTVVAGARVVIDEVLADPATGPNGDANRDGVRDGKEDEFVEIWNIDSKPVTIGGWWLSDDDAGATGRFYFPDGMVLEPGSRAVLFGGGKPKDIPGHVFVDDGSIGNGLTNKGDLVLLFDPVSEDTVAVANFLAKGDLNRSVVRLAEGIYVPHPDLPDGGVISPGRPHPKPTAPDETAKPPSPVFLDDPPSWCRVGALCRFVPRIRNLDGGFVHLETRVLGVVWDRSTGEILWRPDKEGRFRFWQTAVSGAGEKTVRQFDVWVEPRPQIAIVEILADPPPGVNGDVNGDGTRDSQADEFVEILNEGPDAVWLTDWRLSDDDVSARRQFRFPDFTRLHPGERAVLFGGGRPEEVKGQIFVDDGSIGNGLTNKSDVILLIDPVLNDTLARALYYVETDINQSLVWDGTAWIPHQTPPGRGVFSPGLPRELGTVAGDGSDDGDVRPNEDSERSLNPTGHVPAGVIVSEILASPASGPGGDTNADGERHGFQDEFVELRNAGTDTARLDGCRLGDDDAPPDRLFGFPDGTMLPPGGFLVLFGGGSTSDFPGKAFVDDGRIGDGLSNSGDTVVFLSPDGVDTLDAATYVKAPEGTSLVRLEDATLQRHDRLPFTGMFSPGRASPLLVGIRIVPDSLVMEPGSSHAVTAEGIFDSVTVSDITNSLEWIVEDSSVARLEPGMRLRGVAPGETAVYARFGRLTSNAVVRILSKTTDDSGDSGNVHDDNTGGANPLPNFPPVILSRPDTLAIAGLTYTYRPMAEDPDGDPVVFLALRRPAWLQWTETRLEGLPEHTGNWPVVIAATDGGDTTEQAFTIRVVGPGILPASRPDSVAYVGVTWRMSLDISDGIQTQIDGGPVLEASGESLVWRPKTGDEGQRVIMVSMSGNGAESLVLTFRITVWPRPLIRVDEILVNPIADVNGDGTLDPYGDQFIELLNAVEHAVDLTGWTLGDDDGEPFTFPGGTVLNGGDRLTLVGGGLRTARKDRFSAGGRIGNGLAAADRILLIAPAGPDTLVDTQYTNGQVGASLVPDPQNPGGWLPHNQVSSLPLSPGLATPVADTAVADSAGYAANGVEADPVHPFPNPFNLHTTIGFRSTGDPAEFTVYNILGQPVRRFVVAAGAGLHQLVWDGRDEMGRSVGTGIYLIHLRNGLRVRTIRVVLVK